MLSRYPYTWQIEDHGPTAVHVTGAEGPRHGRADHVGERHADDGDGHERAPLLRRAPRGDEGDHRGDEEAADQALHEPDRDHEEHAHPGRERRLLLIVFEVRIEFLIGSVFGFSIGKEERQGGRLVNGPKN